MLSIQSLVQMSSTHIFRECERAMRLSIHSVCILFFSFKKNRTTMNKNKQQNTPNTLGESKTKRKKEEEEEVEKL